MHANGVGIDQDYNEAFHSHLMAAKQDHAKSQFDLGVMYYNGQVLKFST